LNLVLRDETAASGLGFFATGAGTPTVPVAGLDRGGFVPTPYRQNEQKADRTSVAARAATNRVAEAKEISPVFTLQM